MKGSVVMELHEQHEFAKEICAKLIPIITCDELAFVCYNMGVKLSEIYPMTEKEAKTYESSEILEFIDWNERRAA